MPEEAIRPILLCGGSGTRLWPLSRKSYPKQFSSLTGRRSLFQQSVQRFANDRFAPPTVVTSNDFRFIVSQQLEDISVTPGHILIEPDPRDTAPAILSAALQQHADDPSTLLIVAPSDHVIDDNDAFYRALETAIPAARAGGMVTFGIAPDRPETGYGYLELSAPPIDEAGAIPLVSFVEKPDLRTAQDMLEEGRFLWNAGIFMFAAETIVKAFEALAPETLKSVSAAVAGATRDLNFTRLDPDAWAKAPPKSIDYAIMENARNLSVVPYASKWSDLGDWASVWRETEIDGMGSKGQTTAIDCKNTLLRSEVDGLALVGIGLDDIVAVAMPDAVLVSHRNAAQDVKKAVAILKEENAPQAEQFPKDHRPWGWFESLVIGDRFQVKRIVVHPGAALSLQSHHHRSEHWIVVQGTAKVTVDEEVKLVSENQSVYIPLGAVHRMENPGKVDMVLIEVQTGSYLGEDDIIRYEDVYARD